MKAPITLFILPLALAIDVFAQGSPPVATQTIDLRPGWNLVSVQVGAAAWSVSAFREALQNPDTPTDERERLIEIWGYTPSGNAAIPGVWTSYQPKEASFPSDLAVIEPGRGYWVNVSQQAQLRLTAPRWSGALSLSAGWNLVGFPGLDLEPDEAQDIASVFGSHLDRVPQVWTFDPSLQAFVGYDLTAIPQLRDLGSVRPGSGYWVYALESFTLAPDGYLALSQDGDASPPQPEETFHVSDPRWLGTNPVPYVGRQVRFRDGSGADDAYDLNENGIIDSIYTQDTLLFEKASEAIPVTIGNGGQGTLPWVLENNVEWIYTAPADPRTWPAGVTTRPKLASGTVSSERDTVILYADRTGMNPGRGSGESVTVWVGEKAHPVHLLIDVPEIDGDWTGFATTTRAGGKEISLGEVRLALNAFRSTPGDSSRFRAVLNREQAILFPRDVYMDGVFFNGEQFKLTTNFSMPAGDRNAPPYNTFTHTTPDDFPGDADAQKKAARGDKDFDGDGKVDVMNPFPFGLRREVTLIGRRVTPNRLEGSYIEAIRGMLPSVSSTDLTTSEAAFLGADALTSSQPLFIEGTFVLERQSFAPVKRSIFDQQSSPEVSIGGSGGGSRTEFVSVATTAVVQGLTVVINLDLGNVDPALFRISLVSPDGVSVTLHDYAATFAGEYAVPEDFDGEPAAGDWLLVIDWNDTSGERATLRNWSLNLEGAATHDASGRVVRAGSLAPESGVTVRIEGGVTSSSTTSAADGTFTFSDLTENDYTLILSKPGFEQTTKSFFIGEADEAVGDIPIVPLQVTEPEIRATPKLGYEPLYAEFELLLPLDYGATQVSWDFGDGSPALSGDLTAVVELIPGDEESERVLSAPFHLYAGAGHFIPVATLSGGSLGAPVPVAGPAVHVQRRVASTLAGAPGQQVIAGIQIGSVAARMDAGGTDPGAAPFSLTDVQSEFTEGPVTVTMNSATIYQESQWDSATFDLDRFPLGTTDWANSLTREDTDYGRSGGINPPGVGQVFIFYNVNAVDIPGTPVDEKWDARAWTTSPQVAPLTPNLPAFPGTDLFQSNGLYAPYVPANPARPERFRMAVTLGGAVLATGIIPMGDVNLFPGRTLR